MPKVWGSILKGFPSFLIDLSVSAQGSSIPKTKLSNYGYISEPVGGSAPKFSEKSSGFVLAEKSANPFSLACPAQGSPTPGFGSVGQLIGVMAYQIDHHACIVREETTLRKVVVLVKLQSYGYAEISN